MLFMEYNLIKIGKRLKEERKQAGFKSHDALSDYIRENNYRCFKRQTIAKWERGEELPPLDVLCALCVPFNCEVGYLLCEYDCKKRRNADIQEETGLTEDAINALRFMKEWDNEQLEITNLILWDSCFKDSKNKTLSPFLDCIAGFLKFDTNKSNPMYTVDKNGITSFQYRKSLSGKGITYNPKQAHFRLHDMESMYYLKIWDAVKELKKLYKSQEKAPDTN